jgi:hypothetical protein
MLLKIAAFWDTEPCSLYGVDRRFRGAVCLHHQGDEGSDVHTRRRENVKSHIPLIATGQWLEIQSAGALLMHNTPNYNYNYYYW